MYILKQTRLLYIYNEKNVFVYLLNQEESLTFKKFGLVALFNWISNFLAYLIPKLSFRKTAVIRGAFNKFPGVFVQAFKIVVDSSKFTMLFLYILWDDWPFFFKWTATAAIEIHHTKAWLSQLVNFKNAIWTSEHFRRTIYKKICFKLGKNATETYGMLQTAFPPSCMNRASVFEWHKRFKEGRKSVRDDERCGRSKEVNTPEFIGQRVRVRVTMLRF